MREVKMPTPDDDGTVLAETELEVYPAPGEDGQTVWYWHIRETFGHAIVRFSDGPHATQEEALADAERQTSS